jgi:acetyl-CoA acetyltransferase
MRMNAIVAGVGMTRFGKHLETGMKALGADAVQKAIADAGIEASALEAAYVGNAAAGLITGQECIRGQVVLRSIGLGRIPVINVENACASSSTALHQACAMVSAGLYDVVLALGVEKLYHEDKRKSFAAFSGAVDVEAMQAILAAARGHMQRYGTTVEQFAGVSAKNSFHGSLNPRAQFREALSVEEVLASPMIAEPLTRPMCSPIGDGAAAAIVVSEAKARELGIQKPVKIVTSVLVSGWDHGFDEPGTVEVCASTAYEEAGVGPSDLDVVECHDASAPAELMEYESLGLCAPGEGGKLIDAGETRLGGRVPVNTSGGLLRKGHPVGATGIAQIVELTEQLEGRSEGRQVAGARVALAQNGGGTIGTDAAAMCVTILTR